MKNIIVIDGGANVGKATQADMLMQQLMNDGYLVGKMDFPRYHQNTIGHLIQDTLRADGDALKKMPPHVAATLFAADRFESKKQIEEWIAEGRVIIFDRYVSSNMLHQAAKIENTDEREEFFRWVDHLEHEIFGVPRPDLTIYLEVPPDLSQRLLEYVADLGVTVVGEEDQFRLHQAKVSECARYLSQWQNTWQTIPCFEETGLLRPREAIHTDVYAVAKKFLADRGVAPNPAV